MKAEVYAINDVLSDTNNKLVGFHATQKGGVLVGLGNTIIPVKRQMAILKVVSAPSILAVRFMGDMKS